MPSIATSPASFTAATAQAHPAGNRAGNRRACARSRNWGFSRPCIHMNEGHSAFLALERIRVLMAEEGLSFEEALEASRANNVFTTHTSVPAGIDVFDPGLMYEYFHDLLPRRGDFLRPIAGAGPRKPRRTRMNRFPWPSRRSRPRPFGTRSAACTGASRNKCGTGLWPNLPVWEVPITSITNGVHLPTWINGDLAVLYDQYLQPDWREGHGEPKPGSTSPRSPMRSCGRRTGGANGGSSRSCAKRAVASATERKAPAAEVKRLQRGAGAGGAHHRIRAAVCYLQARDSHLPRSGPIEAHPHQSDAPGADRDRREGASHGCTGESAYSRDRRILARSGTGAARGVRRGLQHAGGARAGGRRGPLAQHSPARRGSLRHQRHEGGNQRRAEPEHSGWMVR